MISRKEWRMWLTIVLNLHLKLLVPSSPSLGAELTAFYGAELTAFYAAGAELTAFYKFDTLICSFDYF